MAHKKGGGAPTNDGIPMRSGWRKGLAGELITGGTIIMRQRGTRIKPGVNVGIALTIRSSPRLLAGKVC